METPAQLFIVPALHSFHMGAKKGTTEARQRFEAVNIEKPKLPSIFGKLQSAKEEKAKVKTARTKPATPRCDGQQSLLSQGATKGKIVNTVPLDIMKACDTHTKASRVPARAAAVRQTATPPPEKIMSGVKSSKAPSSTIMTGRTPTLTGTRRAVTPTKATVPPKIKSTTVASPRTKATQQLPTPPATPPLVADKKPDATGQGKIPRSAPMVFPKTTRPSTAPKPATPNAPQARALGTTRLAPTKLVTPAPRSGRQLPTNPPAPKPAARIVRSVVDKKPTSRVPRAATPTSPVKRVAATPTKAIEPVKAAIESEQTTANIEELIATPEPVIICLDGATDGSDVAMQETQVENLEAEIGTSASEITSETVDNSKAAEVSSPIEDANMDQSEEDEEATCSNADSSLELKAISPREAAHLPIVCEPELAPEHQENRQIVEEPVVVQVETKEIPEETPVERAPAAVSGIQARIAAMYASAGMKGPQVPAALVGARMRQFKLPELLETDKASKNERIQQEVEALRSMNKVVRGGAALVKTRAFGGSEPHNAGAEEVPEGRVLSLHCRSIIERVRKERLKGLNA